MELTPLHHVLVDLLGGHGVLAEVRADAVYLPELDLWANLWLTRSREGRFLMDLVATSPDGGVVADQWAALGTDVASATRDGLTSFSRCGFHVVLAALWGVLETDQVDHEAREVGGATWDVYLGPYSGRATTGTPPLTAPAELVDQVLRAFDASLEAGQTHALRVYVAWVNGAATYEALVDGREAPDVAAVVARAGWVFPDAGFVSTRWFVMARLREAGPAHRQTRACRGA